MEYLIWGIKIVLFISIINVWFFRFNKKTPWRGAKAGSMQEEFSAYGLSKTMMYAIGFLKVTSATLLLISIAMPKLTLYPAILMAVLMMGAIGMHFKINDALKKSLPAFIFLLLSAILILHSSGNL